MLAQNFDRPRKIPLRQSQNSHLYLRLGILGEILGQPRQDGTCRSSIASSDKAAGVKKPGPAVVRLSLQNLTGLLHRFLWPMLKQSDIRQFVARRQEIALLAGNFQKL